MSSSAQRGDQFARAVTKAAKQTGTLNLSQWLTDQNLES